MKDIRTAGVVGLGLIGGSIARELHARGIRVLASDADEHALEEAVQAGIVAGRLEPEATGAAPDLVFIAVPVDAAPAALARLAGGSDGARLVMDVGSTKRGIVAAAERLGVRAFVGSHPLAGDHRSGWASSRLGLFAGAPVYVCPTAGGDPAALELALELWRELGGRPQLIDAAEHDRLLAWTSHLPQIASSALAATLAREEVARKRLGPGGRDTTRLAASSAELWTGIALENAASLDEAIRALEACLRALRMALDAGDAQAVRRFFEEGRAWATAE